MKWLDAMIYTGAMLLTLALAIGAAQKARELDDLRTRQAIIEADVRQMRVDLEALSADIWQAVEEAQARLPAWEVQQ